MSRYKCFKTSQRIDQYGLLKMATFTGSLGSALIPRYLLLLPHQKAVKNTTSTFMTTMYVYLGIIKGWSHLSRTLFGGFRLKLLKLMSNNYNLNTTKKIVWLLSHQNLKINLQHLVRSAKPHPTPSIPTQPHPSTPNHQAPPNPNPTPTQPNPI